VDDHRVNKPTSGKITFEGESIVGLSPDAILRRGIALVPENRRIFGGLTVGENLRIGTSARKDRRQAEQDVKRMSRALPVLGQYFDRRARRSRAGSSSSWRSPARCSPAKLLLLDEPTSASRR
jgi:branched-chain amino acid transport system ATP-binding protein